MQNILVTGANGQVGNELKVLSTKYTDYNFFFTDVQELDISNADAIDAFFKKNQITACFNCAAYTAVDKAESDTETAHLVNAEAVKYIAKVCEAHHALLLHISTDYVYHNNQNTPFKEQDATNPQSVYGSSKLAGDQYALEYCSQSIVLRTSWVYSSFGNNFVKTMLRLGAEREQLNVIFDQIGSPTYAADLAATMLSIFTQIKATDMQNWQGIYHYSNEGVCSWYDFARAILNLSEINCKVLPIETKDYPTPAKRPHFSLLNKAKIKSHFNLEIPHWEDSLKNCLEILNP